MRAVAVALAAARIRPSGPPMGENNPHLGFATARAAGAPGSSQDMEVPPGFDPRSLHGTPRPGQPPPLLVIQHGPLLVI
jgi:hypothetical protein